MTGKSGRNDALKTRICKHELILGSWLTISHLAVVEIMAKAGFHWLAIDMEHAPLSASECQEMIRVIDLCGVVPLVRVGANDPLLIKQVMDAGAHGVIVPMVNSKQEAIAAVDAVKYPAAGKRGVGLARAQEYGPGFADYYRWNQKNSIVIVQIETAAAAENCAGIFSVPGIDAYIIGPYDLSASLGAPGDFSHPKVVRTIKAVNRQAEKTGLAKGCHEVSSDYRKVQEKIKEGFTLVAYGTDFLFLGDACRGGLSMLHGNQKKR